MSQHPGKPTDEEQDSAAEAFYGVDEPKDIIRVVRYLTYVGPCKQVEAHLAIAKPDGIYRFGYQPLADHIYTTDTTDMTMTAVTLREKPPQ